MDIKPASFSFQKLAADWYVFAKLLVLFAGRLVALEKTGARNCAAEAHQLQLMSGAALVQINRHITLLADVPRDKEEEGHLNHLKAMALALMTLMLLAQKLRGDFLKLGRRAGRILTARPIYMPALNGPRTVPAFWLLDPG